MAIITRRSLLLALAIICSIAFSPIDGACRVDGEGCFDAVICCAGQTCQPAINNNSTGFCGVADFTLATPSIIPPQQTTPPVPRPPTPFNPVMTANSTIAPIGGQRTLQNSAVASTAVNHSTTLSTTQPSTSTSQTDTITVQTTRQTPTVTTVSSSFTAPSSTVTTAQTLRRSSVTSVTTSTIPPPIAPPLDTITYPTVLSTNMTFHGDGTYYDIGLGACGWINQDSELVSWLVYGNDMRLNLNFTPICGHCAVVHHGANSVQVKTGQVHGLQDGGY
ncbi:hypothetical protein BV898_16130 [Hypsibius exemplaris]|uniref:Chitin-binding type-4 domain-containing protein n=1 Tax=Hypsibius exemplaris TaxID=2072580 RepID=A0A9X6NJL9_HYPEX|nr:hypothetical protein BV898_16130 [Hypsibius exemplaris]